MYEEHRTESTVAPPESRRPPQRPADARRAVRGALARRAVPCPAEALDDALLVTSELTTNAILHGGGITGFAVDVEGCAVRVSVSDRSDEIPVADRPADERHRWRAHGRGWPIVCRLARDVEVAGLPSGGKRITAVVPLR
ncbi:MAG: ATP-binding protein [Streptomyces sp.]|uniref:ATP-binding protein n=1 Tax=Streptomyces sp. TaxID=1931 RepID=UPI0025E53C64|nr:ATP-binding protein [Streptomyces sp.]MBW8797578.1 ATP-binding protein [Streptomyces sp.]